MTFDAGGTGVVAWAGGQCVGLYIPGTWTADLVTAWETAEGEEAGNYAF